MKPLAIVTPWFSRDLKGGAEQQAWQVATRLASRGHAVEVLTTCCRSFQENWATNHFRPGVSQDHGVKIRRFRVDRRNRSEFDRVNGLMLGLPSSVLKRGVNPVSLEDAAIFCRQNINSRQLLNYLKSQQEQYQAFLFIPYLYGPILNGLPLVADRAFLQPCLHNEVYAYLPLVADIFHACKGLLFISIGEAQLAKKLYGPGIIPKSLVVGAGIETGQYYNESVSQVKGIPIKKERFVLYLGRRDATKNVDLLARAYKAFKTEHPNSSLSLILAGPGATSFSDAASGLIDLELVEESEKEALLANCLALFQPSQNESYSRVIMEAWFYQRPVAAHRNCLATSLAVECAKGGWLAETEAEWTELFAHVDQLGDEALAEYGSGGQVYAKEHAVWDEIIDRYETALGLSQKSAKTTESIQPTQTGRALQGIHQLLPNLAYGDAISNHALAIRNYLRRLGYESDIFVKYLDERVAGEAMLFQPNCIDRSAGLIYHHSIGSELTEHAIAHPGAKCLIYHNITPAEFFLPYQPQFAEILAKGRSELKQLAQYFSLSVGDSAYNADELAASGFIEPGVLPIATNPKQWDASANAELMQQLQDGKANLLFVGRLAPNKRQDDLLEAFYHYLTMDQEARLILIGRGELNDPYYHQLRNTIQRLNLMDYVLLPGQVDDTQLSAYYQTAHLFWSMSEHEGFCVPLVEAMWFDIPILAYKSTAVPETLASAGLMFTTKSNLVHVAALAKLLVRDEALRSKIIRQQQKRRMDFTQAKVNECLDELIWKLEETHKQ